MTRRDLLEKIPGLWDLVADHEARCAYAAIKKLVGQLAHGKREAAVQMIIETVRYDLEIRQLVVEKAGLETAMTDFLLGRPLTQTLTMFGIKVEKYDNGYKLIKSGGDHTAPQATNPNKIGRQL